MTTLSNHKPTAGELRADLTARLVQQGLVAPGTPIESALREVPRDRFVPGVPLADAYADTPVYTKYDGTGANISAASQPGIVAMMLGQLDAQPGHAILEAGAGTGYNAALMGHIVGPAGRVVTIDVDEDLVDGARAHLTDADVTNVTAILGDGALGHPEGAPYDRVIATVGAWEVPAPWLEQTARDGRLVVPVRLRGTASRSIAFERTRDAWSSVDSRLAVFMPLRGIGDDPRRTVHLTPESDVALQIHKDQQADGTALAGIFTTPRHEAWTGARFGHTTSMEWMELWLSLTLPNPLMRMQVQPAAKERGTVTPLFGWGAMATTSGSSLAYLTSRRGQEDVEVGVVGHGPDGAALADQVANQVQTFNTHWRNRTASFALPDPGTDLGSSTPGTGRFVLQRPHRPIVVTWE
ncbi:methyltransferase, FxLD system [Actinomadura harenae]|uniref:Protein-L-isoaspartate O-methyltransferase n=1 Tax=Actinomadura harenae TaxID=2483351 RepID=A0A3M2M146_9ACTN|nr:methyltransferase, FxLD system [Actinomadura harenae]RMI43347.1 methyltransferase, FxLD system [Actinomadura harenae]